MKLFAPLLVTLTLGCGGGPRSAAPSNTAAGPDTPHTPPQPGVYGGVEYAGYKRTAELTAFHDLIANRATQDACGIRNELGAAAAAIVKAPSPLGPDPEGRWSGEANELAGITQDFAGNCASADAGMIAADVDAMNRSFQRLLLQLRGP
jgi:hypothetical protein